MDKSCDPLKPRRKNENSPNNKRNRFLPCFRPKCFEFLGQIFRNLHQRVKLFLHPKTKRLGRVSTISVDFLELASTNEAGHASQRFLSTMEVMNVGRRDGDGHRQAEGINGRVALTAFDVLTTIVASNSTHLAGANSLAVYDHDRRVAFDRRLSALENTNGGAAPENTLLIYQAALLDKVTVAGPPIRKILGRLAPLATGLHNVQARVKNPAHIGRARPTTPLGWWNKLFHQHPLLVGQIGLVGRIGHRSADLSRV
jgi:hypothetical protein